MLHRLQVHVVQKYAACDHPCVHIGVGQQLVRIKRHQRCSLRADLRREGCCTQHIVAGSFKGEDVDLAIERRIPAIPAALGDDAIGKIGAVVRKRGTQPAYERFKRTFRVRAVLAGPKHLKKILHEDGLIPVKDQVFQQNNAFF